MICRECKKKNEELDIKHTKLRTTEQALKTTKQALDKAVEVLDKAECHCYYLYGDKKTCNRCEALADIKKLMGGKTKPTRKGLNAKRFGR